MPVYFSLTLLRCETKQKTLLSEIRPRDIIAFRFDFFQLRYYWYVAFLDVCFLTFFSMLPDMTFRNTQNQTLFVIRCTKIKCITLYILIKNPFISDIKEHRSEIWKQLQQTSKLTAQTKKTLQLTETQSFKNVEIRTPEKLHSNYFPLIESTYPRIQYSNIKYDVLDGTFIGINSKFGVAASTRQILYNIRRFAESLTAWWIPGTRLSWKSRVMAVLKFLVLRTEPRYLYLEGTMRNFLNRSKYRRENSEMNRPKFPFIIIRYQMDR